MPEVPSIPINNSCHHCISTFSRYVIVMIVMHGLCSISTIKLYMLQMVYNKNKKEFRVHITACAESLIQLYTGKSS